MEAVAEPRTTTEPKTSASRLPTSSSFASNEELSWEKLAVTARYRPSELAVLCNVSLRTLERHFKCQYGITVMVWLQRLKLNQAYDRVKNGESVKAVAYSLGFKQLSHFSRAFKTAHGVPPRFIASQYETPLMRLLRLELPGTGNNSRAIVE